MPVKRPWRLSEITLKEVRKARFKVAVLPFGATEPHNLHLPYGTDNYEVTAICDRACAWAWKRGGRVALFPAIPFGADQNLLCYPLTVSLDQELLDRIVASAVQSLERQGISRLVIVNGHGGNDFRGGLRTLFRRSKTFCALINWYQALADVGAGIFQEPGEHADEMETSLMQELAPGLVESAWADDGKVLSSRFEAVRRGWAWHPRPFDKMTRNSGCGNPHQASAEKGRRYLAAAEERIGSFLLELARAKVDRDFPFDRRGHRSPAGRAGGGHA